MADLLSWICQKRYRHHMAWYELHRRQADTARSMIAAAERLNIDPGPDIHRVLKDADRLAGIAWSKAQDWA